MTPEKPYGMNGDQFSGLTKVNAREDEEDDGGQLDRDHHRIEPRAFADADDQQRGDEQDDDRGGQVDDGAFHRAGRRAHPAGKVNTEAGEDALEIAAPADRHRHRSDGVLENQIPADHPREDFAERGIGVGVRASPRSGSSTRTPRSTAPRRCRQVRPPGMTVRWRDLPGWPPPCRSGRRCRCR